MRKLKAGKGRVSSKMRRGKCLVLFPAFLFVNAFVVIIITTWHPRLVVNTSFVVCSEELNNEDNDYRIQTILSTPGNHSNAILETTDPPFRHTTEGLNHTYFSRLGTQLKINYSEMCPSDSIMLDDRWKQFVPKHQDCPTLFIVGARKGGTTSLYSYVAKHPDFDGILLDRGPMSGETFYFSLDWESWDWNRFMKIFQGVKSMTGESSVSNLVDCRVPRRLWESCGKQAKIVALLRNPLTRFESNFLMRVALGDYPSNKSASSVVNPQVDEFINKKEITLENIASSWEDFRCLFNPSRNLIFEGLYYVHLMTWLCNFPPENILILNSEEFFENTQSVLNVVISFLGLSPLNAKQVEVITSKTYNGNNKSFSPLQYLSTVDKEKMMAIYKHTNKPLLELLGWKDVEWN